MGWSSGSALASRMIAMIEDLNLSSAKKLDAYYEIINSFEDFDCDNLCECLGESKTFDKAYKLLYKARYKEDYPEDD